LCDGVRFGEEPAAATCSGVLIADDLVLTAGHCARGLECASLSPVFGFHYDADGVENVIDAEDVYRCRQIVGFEIPNAQSALDYGFIRLERPVSDPRKPATLSRVAVALDLGETLVAFGFPGGIPLKVRASVVVRDPRPSELDYPVAV
jgi:hypothetical protein